MRGFWIVLVLLLVVAPGMAQDEAAGWQNRVFYEIFVRSFYDSDGDGIGDFQGIIEKLDYLNDGDPNTTDDLGITGIWLMPINPSPSYHGYDVTDYRAVNPDYGTMVDFEQLLEAAHARGIAVIIDLVVNHTSTQHPWFIDSQTGEGEYADWYIWEESDPGYLGPWGEPAWHNAGGRYYYGVFWSGMPDLNYRNAAVTEEIYSIADFWLDEVGVDGFRLDAAKHIIEDGERQQNLPETREWLSNFNSHITETNPDVFTVGEVVTTPGFIITDYLEEDAFTVGFEFELAESMLSSASSGNKRNVERKQANILSTYPQGRYATFLTNHDQARTMTLLGDVGANKVAIAMLMTSPGVPFLYYGEEVGMMGGKPDPRIRTPMHWTSDSVTAGFTTAAEPWEPLQENVDTANVADQTDDSDSLLSHYREMIHLRNAHPVLQTGAMALIDSNFRGVYSFLRYDESGTVYLVIHNLRDEPADGFKLELEEGPLTSVSDAVFIRGEGDFVLPTLNDEGGFEEYSPLPTLPPFSVTVVELIP